MPDGTLVVGAARVDITPPLHIPHLGFVPRQGIFEGVHDPLWARAAVFAGGDAQVAVLSADALGFSTELFGPGRDFIAEVRKRAAEQTDLEPEGIVIAATHAHSTPETYGITRLWERADCTAWIETLAAQLAGAIRLAWRDRRPARLTHGLGRVTGMSGNRRMRDDRGRLFSINRKPDDANIVDRGALDESVTVLLAEREGAPPVVLANFACHPVTVQVQPLISADFPGVGTAIVERTLGKGACCLFLQGAAGDINPIRDDSREWRDVETYGIMLAGGILQAVGRARLDTPDEVPRIGVRREVLSLQARERPSLEEAAAARAAAEEALAQVPEDHPDRSRRFAEARRAREVYRLAQFGTEPIRAEVQALRLGDVGLAAFPGELFCSLGLRVKERSPAPATIIVECANGCLGYLAPREAWEQGGYEVGLGAWCHLAAGGPERLADTASQLLTDLFGE